MITTTARLGNQIIQKKIQWPIFWIVQLTMIYLFVYPPLNLAIGKHISHAPDSLNIFMFFIRF